MDTNELMRKKRGKTTPEFDNKVKDIPLNKLLVMITDENAQKRTAAVKILERQSCKPYIPLLCKRLSVEKALYTKIAISDCLKNIGLPAINEMIKYIGKTRGNQHDKLPKTIFRKWNYPLPRDIFIRTIVKMNSNVIEKLNYYFLKSIKLETTRHTTELIDALGHICFYNENFMKKIIFHNLCKSIEKNPNNQLIVWKTIRAFQSFEFEETTELLQNYLLHSTIPQFRWESARSLTQINLRTGSSEAKDIIYSKHKDLGSETDSRVVDMVNLCMKKLSK